MNWKNKILVALAVLAMGFTGLAQAQPYNSYFTVQGALADVDAFDAGISGIFTYGVRVPEVDKNFAVEAEFTKSLIEAESDNRFGSGIEASYYTFGAYAVYAHPATAKVHLRARGGLLYEDVEYTNNSGYWIGDDDGFELTFGFGLTMALSEESRFIVEYTVIDSHINHLSAGVQFKL